MLLRPETRLECHLTLPLSSKPASADGSPLESAGLPPRQMGGGAGPAGLGGPGLGAGMAPNFVDNLLAVSAMRCGAPLCGCGVWA